MSTQVKKVVIIVAIALGALALFGGGYAAIKGQITTGWNDLFGGGTTTEQTAD